jgi:hypothetical protein
LSLTLTDSTVITGDLSAYISAALAALPAPISSAALSDTLLSLTTPSGAVSVDLASLKGDTITSVSLADKALVINTNTPSVFVTDLSSIAMPTLQQYTDAEATAALSVGSMYYDSTGLVKVVLQPPGTLQSFSSSFINMSQNPVPYQPSITSNQFIFNKQPAPGDYRWGSWALTPAALTALSFNYDADWCFVLKVRRSNNLAENWKIAIGLDPPSTTWASTDGFSDGNAVPLRASIAPGSEVDKVQNFAGVSTVVSQPYPSVAMDTNLYISISYAFSTKTVSLKYISSTGATLYTDTATYTYTSKLAPWLFYSDGAEYTFTKGIFFSTTDSSYARFSSFFA